MLEFEKKIESVQNRIDALQAKPILSIKERHDIQRLENKKERYIQETYARLTAWQKVLVARHTGRPQAKDYIARLITRWTPLSGDRIFGEDKAVVSGIGFLHNTPVMVIGHDKGHDTTSRIERNFGMAYPEGYRKARRLLYMAEQFQLPVIFLVDTKGAYMGAAAEERGQSQAIAECIETSLSVNIPILSIIIGEGGSGGAVAFASANYIAMLEHSTYSVISPEGCASILWRTIEKKQEAARAQKLTSADLKKLGLIDEIISEPIGGAHRHANETIDRVGQTLSIQLKNMHTQSSFAQDRRKKFLAMGRVS